VGPERSEKKERRSRLRLPLDTRPLRRPRAAATPSSHGNVPHVAALQGGGRGEARRAAGQGAKGSTDAFGYESPLALPFLTHTSTPRRTHQVIVLDKLDYCASLKNLDAVKGKPNFKVRSACAGGEVWARLLERAASKRRKKRVLFRCPRPTAACRRAPAGRLSGLSRLVPP